MMVLLKMLYNLSLHDRESCILEVIILDLPKFSQDFVTRSLTFLRQREVAALIVINLLAAVLIAAACLLLRHAYN